MAASDSSFNATGPTVVAFETSGEQQEIGAGVFGKGCGVHGVGHPDFSLAPSVRDLNSDGTTGVLGNGMVHGLMGRSPIGVRGVCEYWSGEERFEKWNAAVVADAPKLMNNEGTSGVGLRAWSEHNRAGVFQTGGITGPIDFPPSGANAQIHLAPLDLPRLPKEGLAGDLLTRMAVDPPDEAELWFCVKSGTSSSPAVWKKVSLV